MSTYKEQQEKKRVFVLLKKGKFIGVFGNLTKLVEYGITHFNNFPSYSKLSKMKTNQMIVGSYVIEKTKVH